jgi:hypothetical protein
MEVKRPLAIQRTVLAGALFALFVASSITAAAQTYIFNSAAFATGNQPKAVAMADFNADGNIDMAVANYQDNTVSVLLGAPGGIFQKQVAYAVGVNPTAVASGDFNGDGKLDLAVVNQNCPKLPCAAPGSVSILLGNGDGTFQTALAPTNVDDAPNAIVLGDFNNDGHLDAAVANPQSDNITVLLGTGTGTFTTTNYAVGSNDQSLTTGDYNGDGIPDLAVVNKNSSNITVLLGNGNGTFNAQPVIPTGTFPVSIVTGDFNGDGNLDLATANSFASTSGVSILLGNGNGTFQSHKEYATLKPGDAITAADFNGNGILDLAVTSNASDSVGVLLGKGDGTFPTHTDYVIGPDPAAVAAADVNNDGAQDLVVVSATNNNVTVLPGTGKGTFQLNQSLSLTSTPKPSAVALGDFQGAGKPNDMAVADFNAGTVTILLGNGTGGFTVQPTPLTVGTNPVAIVAKDVNNDTKIDLVVANNGNSTVSVLLGNGDGTFQAAVPYSLSSKPTCLLVDDYNGDGIQDLAVCDKGISILLGNGGGTFHTPVDYSTGGDTHPVAAVDGNFVEGGALDLAVVAPGTNSVVVLLNKGNGTFSSPHPFPVGTGPTAVAVSDFNGDGFLDLVVTNTGTNHVSSVSFLSGNGNGSFNTPINYAAPQGPLSIVAEDLDGDGKTDLAIGYSSPSNNGISVITGNGDGTFNAPANHVTTWGAKGTQGKFEGIAVGDVNGDFAPDLVAVDEETNLVSWYLNSSLASPSPNALNFGDVKTGTSSNPLTVTVTNSGSANLTVSSVAAAPPFSQTNTCSSTVAPGTTCSVSVTFTPTVKGQASGTLTITDSSPTGTQNVTLSGTGD